MRTRSAACALLAALLLVCGASGALGATWQLAGTAVSTGQAPYPSLALDALDGNRPFLAYSDQSIAGAGRIFVKRLVGSTWFPLAFNASRFGGQDVWLATHPLRKGSPWVAYQDAEADGKLSVVAWSNNRWNYVGCDGPGISLDAASKIRLAFAPDGTPYVAYQDGAQDGKLSVLRFTEFGKWVYAGGVPGVTAGGVDYISLAINAQGVPFVSFQDTNSPNLVGRVIKLVGNTWTPVGSALSSQEASRTWLAFHPTTGVPHVAFTDKAHSNRVSVVRLSGSSWLPLGPFGFAGPFSGANSLAFDAAGVPHAAFQCATAGISKPCVRFYNAATNTWLLKGNAGFSTGEAALQDIEPYLVLRFAGNAPFISFNDKGLGGKAVVKRLV